MTPEPWGYKIPISPEAFAEPVIIWRPKWWQFWRRPKTLPLGEALQQAQDRAYARMLRDLSP